MIEKKLMSALVGLAGLTVAGCADAMLPISDDSVSENSTISHEQQPTPNHGASGGVGYRVIDDTKVCPPDAEGNAQRPITEYGEGGVTSTGVRWRIILSQRCPNDQ